MALVDIFAAIMSLIIAVWSALLGFGLYALVYAVLTQSIISSIGYLILGTHIYYKPSITYSHSELKGFYSFGFYQMGEKSINYLGANIDKILISRILGMQAVGFYNMAWQIIILPVSRINPIVTKVAFPVYAKIQNNIEAMNTYYQVLIRGLSLVTIPLLAFIYFFSHDIVLVIFGKGWNTTADLLPLLALVGIVKALGNPGGSIILAKGYANIGFWWNVFWIILVTSSLYLALTFQQDILTVPKVLAAITILFGWIWHYIISIVGKIKYSSILFNLAKIVLICFLIAGLSYFVSQNMKIENALINLLANIIICLILYLPYVYFFEKDTLKQLMQGLD
jgi:O-antigen/teichoic acid export membrane protein